MVGKKTTMNTKITIDLKDVCQKLGFDPSLSPLGAACLEEIRARLQTGVTIEVFAACLHAAAKKQPQKPKRRRKPDGGVPPEPGKAATPPTTVATPTAAAPANQKSTLP